jgi:hypothetical protein
MNSPTSRQGGRNNLDFAEQHRSKLYGTNPFERLNNEVKRRADVVRLFPMGRYRSADSRGAARTKRTVSQFCYPDVVPLTAHERPYCETSLHPNRCDVS